MNCLLQRWESITAVKERPADCCIVSEDFYLIKARGTDEPRSVVKDFFSAEFEESEGVWCDKSDKTLLVNGRRGCIRIFIKQAIHCNDKFSLTAKFGIGPVLYMGSFNYDMTVAERDKFLQKMKASERKPIMKNHMQTGGAPQGRRMKK